MMITGDYHHTAIAVARDVGMVKPQGSLIIIDTATQPQPNLDPSLLTPCSPLQPPLQIPHTPGRVFTSDDRHRSSSIQQLPSAAQQADDRHSYQSRNQQHVALTADPVIKTRHVSWDHVLQDNTGMSQGKQAVLPQSSAAVKTSHVSKLLQFPALAKAKSGLALSETPQPVPPESRRLPLEGLTFVAAGLGNLNASQALAALAAGQMQCAVTGDALESLLQQRDLSSLETVMSNAVVFSRMQPHQKGQVMDLLSTRGMHQLFDGQPRFIQVPHAMACDCWCRLSH
jgi:magnesium-transporting ATPase (P-type)